MGQRDERKPNRRRLQTESWPRQYKDLCRTADRTDVIRTDSWRGIFIPDIEDGTTTSPQSLPFTSPSSNSSYPHSLNLDRSKSAPASINQGPSPIEIPQPDICHPYSTLESTVSSPLPPLKVGEPFLDPPVGTLCPQSQVLADSISSCVKTAAPNTSSLPSQEPFCSTVSENNIVTGGIITGDSDSQIDTVLRNNVMSSGTVAAESPFTLFNPTTQIQAFDQEVDMDVSSNAKQEVGYDLTEQFQREHSSVMENVSGAQPQLMPVPDLKFQPCHAKPATSSGSSPAHSDSEKSMDRVIPSERDQLEADNAPSLAKALKELHKLLMSNSCPPVCERSPLSDSNAPTPSQDADEVDQDPTSRNHNTLNPTVDSSSTATANDMEDSVAKADFTSQSVWDTSDLPTSSNSRHPENQTTSLADPGKKKEIQCSYTPEGNQAQGVSDEGGTGSTLSEIMSFQEDLEFRETPDIQKEQDVADGNTSGIVISNSADPSQQCPLSLAAGSSNSCLGPVASPDPQKQAPEMDPLFLGDSIQPSSQPSMGRFPLEHIQRIQASGFSAHEAAEALEQAQGIVELALLMLLARTITVPT